jgi:hypothetical protein
MGTDLVVHQQGQIQPSNQIASNLTDVQRLGNILAASGYFADAREMAQAAVKVLAGQELGIPPVASMMGINIIKGKVALGGNLIASRIRAHGYDYRHKQFDNKGCTLVFFSKQDREGKREVLGESSFTEEDAKAAGLLGNDTYKKFPRNMFFNRAISNGAKWYTPDVFGGAPVYTPEELGARVDSEGDVIHENGSREAQQQVLDRKLAEADEHNRSLPADRQYKAPEPKASAPSPPVVDDVDPEVAKIWAAMGTKIATVCTVFDWLKSEISSLSGNEECYYAILSQHGFEHANDVKKLGIAKARKCAADLYACVSEFRKANEPEAVLVNDEGVAYAE